MGFRPLNMTHSEKLEAIVLDHEADFPDGEHHDGYDMTSTAGYDNDGSIGPELLDNGIGLTLACRDYDPAAAIFFAIGETNTCYYQFGRDEDDAIRRLLEAMRETEEARERRGEECEEDD